MIITGLIRIVPTSMDLYVPVLYSQQLVTVSCPELTDYILTHCLLWFILGLFFHLLLFCRIAPDILFTHISHDSFWCHPSIYIHILWILLMCPPICVFVFGFCLAQSHSFNSDVILLASLSYSYNSFWYYSPIYVMLSQMFLFLK